MTQKLVKFPRHTGGKGGNPDKVLISKQKWTIVGLLVVILNPLPAGLIYGFALRREPAFKNEGKLMIIFSLLWGAVSLALAKRYFNYGV